jgi:septal ring factor EnvC (AmiA/AmiB activator)
VPRGLFRWKKVDKLRRDIASKKSELKSLERDLVASKEGKSEAKAELKEEKPSKKQ